MKNSEIADLFNRLGTLLEIKGDNIFKIKAYYRAAENISGLGEDIAIIRRENRLGEIPGIGQALQEKISEYLDTGRVKMYDELIAEIPESVLELVDIPSVGPKKAKLFYDQLGVKSLADLQKAVKEGKLVGLPGIKEKTVENIEKGLSVVEQGQERMNIAMATRVADEIIAVLKKLPEVKDISVAGSLRRQKETIRDIDLLVDSANPQKIMETFTKLPQVKSINAFGETKSSVLTKDNVQVDLRVVEPKSFGAALLYFTGSKSFNIKLRQIAQKKDMKVNEYGVFDVKTSKERCLASKTEEECFKVLGLPMIAPEMREDFSEAECFSGQPLPKLIELKDIKGEVHVHSTYSDGAHTIEQMAEAAMARGYGYLAISDHSEKLKIAGGLSEADVIKKKKEIDVLNKKFKNFRVLMGTELEVDTEGNLDYNSKILKLFDVVVASVHSHFDLPPAKLTARILKVCQNKAVHIIGHPTGVHLGKRGPMDFDLKEVCRAAADNNVYLEINSFPNRLDLNSNNVYFARSQGVKFVINTDAHHRDHLEFMKFGVAIARRGWLTKADVLNTKSLDELLKAIKK